MSRKHILVTGGCGFLGSHFINTLFLEDHYVRVINMDALYYSANISNVQKHIRDSKDYTFIHGNIRDYPIVIQTLRTFDIDVVVHFAAQTNVDNSFINPDKYMADNVQGTHTLLEACRSYGNIKQFIYISTCEVYKESLFSDDEKRTDQSLLCPMNPYAATKASAEMLVQSYFYSYHMPIYITRITNVYGPNQYPEKLIPKFIKLLKEDSPVPIYGDGTHERGFLHVYDVIQGILCILEKGVIGEIYNIGCEPQDEYTVMEIAKGLIMMIKRLHREDDEPKVMEYIEYVEDRPVNGKRYLLDNQKIKDLGWSITVSFIDGITDLVQNM